MNLVIVGLKNNRQDLINRKTDAHWIEAATYEEAKNIKEADAFFFLENKNFNQNFNFTGKPVFVNSVSETLKDKKHPKHVLRFNGWSGWLQKDKWEIAGQLSVEALTVLGYLKIEPICLPDEPGLISPAVISLIINEAFYAETAGVSSRSDIDTAMKLGTGYPFGPFEWAENIGIDEIYKLLYKLAAKDERYKPSEALRMKKNKK